MHIRCNLAVILAAIALVACVEPLEPAVCTEPCEAPTGAEPPTETEPGKGDSTVPADPEVSDVAVDVATVMAIDAVLDHPNGKAYFFRGDEYIRYDLAADTADGGYPRRIDQAWRGLFARDIDAVVRTSAREAHFFSGDQYILYDLQRDAAAPGYPVAIAEAWPGLWESDIDAALAPGNGKVYFFSGNEYIRWDIASWQVDDGYPRAIADGFRGLWESGIDAVLNPGTGKFYFFRGEEYVRYDWATDRVEAGYPLPRTFLWPGLWDANEGTGRPDYRLPAEVEALLLDRPSEEELTARRARVALSAGSAYEDLTPRYPLYVSSIEERLGVYGCGLLRHRSSGAYRFRCATDTSGPLPLDIEPYAIDSIDWSDAAYHRDQVSQGDFMARAGTPLSVFGTDDNEFYIHSISANQPTGSIVSGLNIKVRFAVAGTTYVWGFSHLNTAVPQYVLDAYRDGTPLEAGTVFGFIGYTGNLWTGTPPARDQRYAGTGGGLPQAHSHIWFTNTRGGNDMQNHGRLAWWARRVLDFSGIYPFGGG